MTTSAGRLPITPAAHGADRRAPQRTAGTAGPRGHPATHAPSGISPDEVGGAALRPRQTGERRPTPRPTLADLHSLPAVLDIMAAARILGIGRTKAYELAQDGQFPCRLLRIGTSYRVPTLELLRVLGAAPTG